jgi:hypothetical protein
MKVEAKNFIPDNNRLYRKIRDGNTALYLEWLFLGDFIQRMHGEHGHLSYSGMIHRDACTVANDGAGYSSIIFILLEKTRIVGRGKVSQNQTKFFRLISMN